MAQDNSAQPQELLLFLREHRGNEVNFRLINERISEQLQPEAEGSPQQALKEVQEKYGEAYTTAREKGGSAWPEFERYISELERCLVAVGKED